MVAWAVVFFCMLSGHVRREDLTDSLIGMFIPNMLFAIYFKKEPNKE